MHRRGGRNRQADPMTARAALRIRAGAAHPTQIKEQP
jgi:hypothetical protein